ncbi:MAG: peptide ABC transporter [Desulfobacteraceae bacterium 4484_190.3]|nr:MAG: peptide ABC transporter [Desulfobacteraceae bacterium 4484_190.3]
MRAYIIQRLLQGVIVLFLVTVVIFLVMRLLPGDPILLYLTQDEFSAASVSDEKIAAMRHEFGLDKPLPVQYIDWAGNVFRGDLGKSIMFGTKVTSEIGRSLPVTLHLGLLAYALSIIFGIPLGIIAAVRQGKFADTLTTTIANIGVTAPVFWFGILLIYVFSAYLDWLPTYGYTSPFENFGLSTLQSIMPVLSLMLFPLAGIARQTRSSMLEVVRQDYIRTAYAKGLREWVVIMRHALKNGLIPVVTMAGTMARRLLGGMVLVENVFNIPGLGRLTTDAIFSQDYEVVQGTILVVAIIVLVVNLIVDISYGWFDPRIRYS